MATDGERLSTLELHAQKTEQSISEVYGIVTTLAKTVEGQGGKLDQLMTVVTKQQAQPRFNPRDALDSIKSVIVILMALFVPAAGALIWMITTVTSASDTKQNADIAHNREVYELRLQALERRYGDWSEFNRLIRKGDKL